MNGDDVLLNPSEVPNMVETMALTNDMVGFTLAKTLESRVHDGVTIPEVCAGLKLSAVKDTEEVVVEVGPSIDRGGVAIPKVGLFRSKYGKGIFPFLERAKMGEFDKWQKENRKEGIQSGCLQASHFFLQ